MQPNIRVMLFDEDGERFFGEGPCRLLHAIEQTGSLRAAAQSMQPSRLHTISTSAALRCTTRVNFHHPFLQNDFSMPAFTQILSLPFSC